MNNIILEMILNEMIAVRSKYFPISRIRMTVDNHKNLLRDGL